MALKRAGADDYRGIVLETYANSDWPSARIYFFDKKEPVTVNQDLYGLRKMTMNNFEVGQLVTIDNDSYMNSLPGVILDVSASDDYTDAMYTVDVEDHGTQFFYGSSLASAEEEVSSDVY